MAKAFNPQRRIWLIAFLLVTIGSIMGVWTFISTVSRPKAADLLVTTAASTSNLTLTATAGGSDPGRLGVDGNVTAAAAAGAGIKQQHANGNATAGYGHAAGGGGVATAAAAAFGDGGRRVIAVSVRNVMAGLGVGVVAVFI